MRVKLRRRFCRSHVPDGNLAIAVPGHELLSFVVPKDACQLSVAAITRLCDFLADIPRHQVARLKSNQQFVRISRILFDLTDFARPGAAAQLDS